MKRVFFAVPILLVVAFLSAAYVGSQPMQTSSAPSNVIFSAKTDRPRILDGQPEASGDKASRITLMVSNGTLITLPTNAKMAAADQMKLPPARNIPGLTAEDKFPNGCVDCHINMPNINQDERISTLMSKWNKKVGSKLLEKAQAVTPAGVTLKGIHPRVAQASKNIPDTCTPCHSNTSKNAPPFAALMHSIHLTGGNENHFMTIFQGECTHCHKMDATKGVWIMPSGSEK